MIENETKCNLISPINIKTSSTTNANMCTVCFISDTIHMYNRMFIMSTRRNIDRFINITEDNDNGIEWTYIY